MANDILNVNIKLIEDAIKKIKTEVAIEYKKNIEELSEITKILTTEDWISSENEGYVEKTNEYIEKMKIIQSFYEQVGNDLDKIKAEMEYQMNKQINVHFS